uniref:Glycosyl transferase family 2 n=1 Tax=Tetraselmis sp. GSL018 TaxID=582737 RepID=A0A061R7S5_9CHLO
MLDSDDLLGRTYMEEAAAFVSEGFPVDIVPGCMRNFDAVSSDWCFPDGWSVQGAIHWNKFHASVLMSRRLLEAVGGYDPGLPWGLEDWNFWLSSLSHAPIVRFSPALTFYYRHHQGTSMRKQMFSCCLEEVKAMVRTNHPELYEPLQLMRDHSTIGAMRRETFASIEGKINKFHGLPKPLFWRGLRYAAVGQHDAALRDFKLALKLSSESSIPQEWNKWQVLHNMALVQSAMGNPKAALESINEAFKYTHFNEILELKATLENSLYGPADDFGLGLGDEVKGRVEVTPVYWTNPRERAELYRQSVTGQLHRLSVVEPLVDAMEKEHEKSMLLMRLVATSPCPRMLNQRASSVNMVANPHFEGSGSSRRMGQVAPAKEWEQFGKGFEVRRTAGRPGTKSDRSLCMSSNLLEEERGAVQEIFLGQQSAAPLLIRGWARADNVSGGPDTGFALYADIYFQDGDKEWGLALPFDPRSTEWQVQSMYLERGGPIKSINLYCMFRGHTGTACFDDVVLADPLKAACSCLPGEHFDPSPGIMCEPCPVGYSCVLGETFRNATHALSSLAS